MATLRSDRSSVAVAAPATPDPQEAGRAAFSEALEEKRQLQLQMDREIVELRALLRESERQLATVRRSLSYRLGAVFVDARTFSGLIRLPKALFQLWRAQRERKYAAGPRAGRPADGLRYVDAAIRAMTKEGPDAAANFIRALPDRHKREKARALLEVAARLRPVDPARAGQLGVEAALLSPAENRLRGLIFDLYEDGFVNVAAAILERTDAQLMATAAQKARAAAIWSDARELTEPLSLPARAAPASEGESIAVISPRALPSHAEAQTYRARHVAEEAVAKGRKAVLITEPGYRYKNATAGRPLKMALEENLWMVHLPPVDPHVNDIFAWVAATATLLEEQFNEEKVGEVHCAQTLPLAFAAAMAARRCGLPFTLDAGTTPALEDGEMSERLSASWSRLDTLLHASDRVIARSANIARILRARAPGTALTVEPDKVPDSFTRAGQATARDIRRELGITDDRPMVGMICDVDHGEDLLQIVRALPLVRAVVPDATLVFCGSGRVGQTIRREAASLRLGEGVIVPDGFVRQRLAQYVSAFSIIAFPKVRRKLLGSATPFELRVALELGTPVVARDCDWAREWCEGHSGAVLVAGDGPSSLADAILEQLRRNVAGPARPEEVRIYQNGCDHSNILSRPSESSRAQV